MANQIGNFGSIGVSPGFSRSDYQGAQDAYAKVAAERQARENQLASQVTPMPQIPQESQKPNLKHQMELFGVMALLSALGSRHTGEPITSAMNNLTASVKGIQEGNTAAQKAHEDEMWKHFNTALELHKQTMDEYKTNLDLMNKDPKYGPQAVYLDQIAAGKNPEIAAVLSNPKSLAEIRTAGVKAHYQAQLLQAKMGGGPIAQNINKQTYDNATAGQKMGLQYGISPTALDTMTWHYILTGQLPYRRGTGGGRDANTAVLNRAAEISSSKNMTPEQLATMPASYKADAHSLSTVTTIYDNQAAAFSSLENNFTQWENAAKGLKGQYSDAKDTFQRIDFSGITNIDQFRLKLNQISNDPNVIRYLTSSMFVAMDVARINQGSASTASLHEGTIREAQALINSGYDDNARAGLKDSIINDSRGQMAAREAQMQAIRDRMGNMGVPSSISSKDQEALAWAQSHPDDPRAKRILELNQGR